VGKKRNNERKKGEEKKQNESNKVEEVNEKEENKRREEVLGQKTDEKKELKISRRRWKRK
jgi:hypothetical protein